METMTGEPYQIFEQVQENRHLVLESLRTMPPDRHSQDRYFETPDDEPDWEYHEGHRVCVNGLVMVMAGCHDLNFGIANNVVCPALGITTDEFMTINSLNYHRTPERMVDVIETIFDIGSGMRHMYRSDGYEVPILQPMVW
jgi:hypothetical protein